MSCAGESEVGVPHQQSISLSRKARAGGRSPRTKAEHTPMATLARCLICPPPPGFPRCLPLNPVRTHDRTRGSPDDATSSHGREKISTPYSKAIIRNHIMSSQNYLLHIPATVWKEADNIQGKVSAIGRMILKCTSDHQKTALVASFVTNALIFALPFEALAGTCVPNNSFLNMPLLFTIAMIGATVGGLLARQRKGELKRLNDQLRQINESLKRQAKFESYAPSLSYAPVYGTPAVEVSIDPRKEHLLTNLRAGKSFLRNQDPEKARMEFKKALDLAQSLGDQIEEKKAARGLGASLQRQGKYREAIKHHSRVLEIANRSGDDSGCTEAYGAIADCYTELGDLEQAGKFYDKYISRLTSD